MLNQWQSSTFCRSKFEKYKESISANPDDIKEIYKIVKEEAPNLYTESVGFDLPYRYVERDVLRYELDMPKLFICPSDPDLTPKNKNDNMLDYIVYKARCALASKLNIPSDKLYLFKEQELTNKCHIVSNIVKKICDEEKIICKTIMISPGFDEDSRLCDGYGWHYFNIIYLDNKAFLIDCSYRQFFTRRQSNLERIGVPLFQSAKPGVFMLMDEKRKKVAETILKKGWIILTNDALKNYLDGFAISYRNGLYYEETNDFSFTTKYTADDYKAFLSGYDSQVKHEGKDVLGYQKVLLKNPYLFEKS